QGDAFDQGRRDDHRGTDVATSRRLPGGPFHGCRSEPADAKAGAEHRETRAEARSEVPERALVHVRSSNFLDALAPAAQRGRSSRGMGPGPPEARAAVSPR